MHETDHCSEQLSATLGGKFQHNREYFGHGQPTQTARLIAVKLGPKLELVMKVNQL